MSQVKLTQPNVYPLYQGMKYFHWNIKGGRNMLYGIDISNWNTPSDAILRWADFCICKATEGKSFRDGKLFTHLERYEAQQETSLSELNFGTYHFARPDAGNSAATEAEHYLSVVKDYIGLGIMALDVEGAATNKKYIGWVFDWLEYVHKKTGIRPMLYVSASFAKQYAKVCKNDYGLWVANYKNYGNAFPEVKPETIAPWKTLAMWQWQNGKQLPKYSHMYAYFETYFSESIDQNVFNGDSRAWHLYASGSVKTEEVCDHCPTHCPGDK